MNPTNINQIFEIMNTVKIRSEQILHDAVRSKQYIIGSYQTGIGLSFSDTPTVQFSESQARAECKRLAKLHPGKTFVFAKLCGAEVAVPQPQTISI